jgi:hypothetical protein
LKAENVAWDNALQRGKGRHAGSLKKIGGKKMKSSLFLSRVRAAMLVFGFFLVVSAFSTAQSAKSEAPMPAKLGGMPHEDSPLEVILRTDQDSYKLGDEISVQVLLINRSQSPLYIYAQLDWGESASLSLWLKDAVSGKYVPEEFIADALPPPPGSKDEFVKLLPNHVYGVVLTLKLVELNVKKRGKYELLAEYHSPIPSSMNFGLPIWSREKGTVPSNRVTIAVGE